MSSPNPVADAVRLHVATVAKYPLDQLSDTMELTGIPLKLDGNQQKVLTLRLRRYVKKQKPNQTVLLAEVSKDKQTVGGLITLIKNKLSATPAPPIIVVNK